MIKDNDINFFRVEFKSFLKIPQGDGSEPLR